MGAAGVRKFVAGLSPASSARSLLTKDLRKQLLVLLAAGSRNCILFPPPFRFRKPLGHLLIVGGVMRPALCSTVPTVVLDSHVNATVDEELHRLVVPVPDELVQNARRLMRTPGRIDVCAVLKQEVGHLQMA